MILSIFSRVLVLSVVHTKTGKQAEGCGEWPQSANCWSIWTFGFTSAAKSQALKVF
jgi:hypothetical protein